MSNFACDRCQRTITDADAAYAIKSDHAGIPIALICSVCESADHNGKHQLNQPIK